MPASQRHAAPEAIANFDELEAASLGDPAQVAFQECGAVDRVLSVLKRGEAPLQDERQDAQHAQLIRSRDDHPSARGGQRGQLADERPGIFQVLDCLDRRDEVTAAGCNRPVFAIEIDVRELGLVGKTR